MGRRGRRDASGVQLLGKPGQAQKQVGEGGARVRRRPKGVVPPSSDERRPEAFEAPLHGEAGRRVDAAQSLQLLGAQLVVGQLVLAVEGLCGEKQ